MSDWGRGEGKKKKKNHQAKRGIAQAQDHRVREGKWVRKYVTSGVVDS